MITISISYYEIIIIVFTRYLIMGSYLLNFGTFGTKIYYQTHIKIYFALFQLEMFECVCIVSYLRILDYKLSVI